MPRPPFLDAVNQRVLVCDGAMGTMLYARGIFLNRSFDELNLTQPLIERVRLHLHAGFLRYRYDSPYAVLYGIAPTKNVIDARFGLRSDLDIVQLEVAWVGVSNHTAGYLLTGRNSPNGVVAALSISF